MMKMSRPLSLSTAPVVSEILRESDGAFVLRSLDEARMPAGFETAVPEAQLWQTQKKTHRIRAESIEPQPADIVPGAGGEEETGEWLPSGSTIPAGDAGVNLLESLVHRANGLLVLIFFRTLNEKLGGFSSSLLPMIRKKGGRVIGITSTPLPGDILERMIELGIQFPLLVDSAATLAGRYRVYVSKSGVSHDGCVVLQTKEDELAVTIGGSTASIVGEKQKEIEVLFHYHSSPGTQTDEEADRGDEVPVHLEQRVPEPWVLAVKYGLGTSTFKSVPIKISNRAVAELQRVKDAQAKGAKRLPNAKASRQQKHFDRFDPDSGESLCDCDWCLEYSEPPEQKYYSSFPSGATVWKVLVGVWGTRAKAKHLAQHTQQLCRSAVKRLARDWKEVTLHPLPSISAHPPYDNDIFEWHADMIGPKGPYEGVRYHLQLDFPRDYPLSPPEVRFRGKLHHDHVFGSYICLDMLTDVPTDDLGPGSGKPVLWQGWTSAYSVQSILVQLQAFLFDGARQPKKIRSDVPDFSSWPTKDVKMDRLILQKVNDLAWNKTIEQSIQQTRQFKCVCQRIDKNANQFVKDIQDQHVPSIPIPDLEEEEEKREETKQPPPPTISKISLLAPPGGLSIAEEPWMTISYSSHVKIPSASSSKRPSVTKVVPVPVSPNTLSTLTPTTITDIIPTFDIWSEQLSPDLLYRSSYFGRIVRLASFGVFVELGLPQKQWAMCHVSQLREEFTEDPSKFFAIGDLIKCRITRLEPEISRVACSFKGRLGKLIVPIPHHLPFAAKITTFIPNGGFEVSFLDTGSGKTLKGIVRNDALLTHAFNGLHFWSANEVCKIGQLLTVKLIDIEMQPYRTFIMGVVDAQEIIEAATTAARKNGSTSPVSHAGLYSTSPDPIATRVDTQCLMCFHSKADYRHELLGLPINQEFYSSGELSNVHAQMDLLGATAFQKDGVRRGVSRAPFTHWLPIFIDEQHAGDLRPHEEAIADICFKGNSRERTVFHPLMVLKVLPALLNTIIVSMMSGSVHESIAALSGYTSVFQLLVAFAIKYPEIQQSANKRLAAFLESESGRSKKECPNLGELLAFLAITSEFAWMDMAKALVSEVIDRNVKWTLLAFPELRVKVAEENLVSAAEKAENKAALKGLPKGVSQEEAQRIKERRQITLIYQKTGKTPAQQAAEASAAASAAKSKEADEEKRESDELKENGEYKDAVDVGAELADSCDYPASDSDETLAETADAEAVEAIANEPEEVPLNKADKKRFALLSSMDRGRLPKTFKAGRVSYRLVLFHVHFLRIFRGLTRATLVHLPTLHRRFQLTHGRPSPSIELDWQTTIKSLKLISTWRTFFQQIGLSVPSDEYMLGWLRQAIDNSLRRRYHNNRPPPLTSAQIAKREAAKRKREFEARLAEDGDHGDSNQVDYGDFTS